MNQKTFNVEMVEEHEDGSATVNISGDKDSMHALFEAFFTQALINGIDYAVEGKEHWLAEKNLVDAALEMHKAIWAWKKFETVDWVDLKEFEDKFNDAVQRYTERKEK